MDQVCACCGLKLGFWKESFDLENGQVLCMDCISPIQDLFPKLYEAKTIDEFASVRNVIIEKSKGHYNEDILYAVYILIDRILARSLYMDNQKPTWDISDYRVMAKKNAKKSTQAPGYNGSNQSQTSAGGSTHVPNNSSSQDGMENIRNIYSEYAGSSEIGMFANVGAKIKGIAKFLTWGGIILSVIMGFILMSQEWVGMGFLIMIVGSLMSWLSSLGLYAFGQFVDNSDTIVRLLDKK